MAELAVPGGHGRQEAALSAPVVLLKVAAGQKMHVEAELPPSTSLNVPRPHSEQAAASVVC